MYKRRKNNVNCLLVRQSRLRIFGILFSLLFLNSAYLLAQVEVSGLITTADNEALPGVNILEKGTTNGVVTDLDGKFTFNVSSENSVIVVSFLGYLTEEILIGSQRELRINLVEDITALEEVVVIGYGTVKKSDLTGAVSSVKGEDLVKIPSSSPEQALQGKVAGVQITSNSGAPGSSPTVRIRGVGTFGNADPIFVVDGMIMDNISFLSPQDISSMEVLKDASATAIYGSRGANGVIIVTTKLGEVNTKTKVDVSAYYGVQTIQKYIDLLNGKEFAQTLNKISPGSFNNISLVENTDWQNEVYRNYAPIQNYQVSVSGGSQNATYYLGAGYFNQEGIIPKSGYQKFSLKINNQYSLSKNIKVGHNITVTRFDQKNAPNVVASTLRAWPTDKPTDEAGEFIEVRGNGNPLASIEYSNNTNNGVWTVSNFFGEVKFLNDFLFKSSFGVDYKLNDSKSFTPEFYVSPTQNSTESSLSKTRANDLNWLWENTLNYNKEFTNHRVNAIVGYTAQESSGESISASGTKLLRDEIQYLSNDLDKLSISNPAYQWSIVSYLFRVNYSAFDKYLFTATYRRDGSSKFSKENRWGDFPSFALGWRISNETFMADVSFLSNLKLRASWGIIGNEKVASSNRYTLIQKEQGAVFGASETLYSGATYGVTGNPLIRWEEAKQTNIGFEFGFLDNKLTAELDYYHKVTEDILIDLSLPGHYGNGSYSYTTFNAADVLNRGFELALSWKDNIGDFKYNVSAVGTTVYNEVLSLGSDTGSDNFIPMGSLGNGQNVKRVEVGYPIGYFFGYQVEGVFQDETELAAYPHMSTQGVGDFRYKDVNTDGEITPADRTEIGSPIPDFIYGFSLEMSYHSFSLALDFQGEYGKDIYNGKNAVRAGQYNYERNILDAWDGPGSTNSEPRPTAGGVNYSESTWFDQDGSFFRLRNVTLGYVLPTKLTSDMRIGSASVFLRGTNVFTLTKYTGYTPEIGGGIRNSGIDSGLYPVTSIYSLGLNVNF